MRHRKPSTHASLVRAGVLGTALAAATVLGSGTALAGSASSHCSDSNDPDVVDIDDVLDVGSVDVQDTLDGIGITIN